MIRYIFIAGALILGVLLGGTQVRGADQEVSKFVDMGVQTSNPEEYHIFGNGAMYRYYMRKYREYQKIQKLKPVQSEAPYTNRFGTGISAVGSGVGFTPFYSRRINARSFYQIRFGFLTMWHTVANLKFNNSFQPGSYGTTLIIPMYFSYKRYFWENKFSKKVYPYAAAGAGPMVGFNFPTKSGNPYWQDYGSSSVRIGPTVFSGVGVNIVLSRKYWLTVEGRYNVMYFPSRLGPWNNYSGPSLFFGISRGFYF